MLLFIGVPLRAARFGSTYVSCRLWQVDSRCRHGHCSWHRSATSQKMGCDSSLTLAVVSRLLVCFRCRPSRFWASKLAGFSFRDIPGWPRAPHGILLAHADLAQEIRGSLSRMSAKRPHFLTTYNGLMKNRSCFYARRKNLRKMAFWSVVIVIVIFSACQNGSVPGERTFPKSSEQQRSTSPNGRFDAVLVTDAYGPAAGGGVDSNVYIVERGSPVRAKPGSEIFSADPLTGAQLFWKRDHLLEIHYGIAYIHRFRNVWGLSEVENVGSAGEGDFDIEIQLMPASDASAMAPDGSFRHPGYQ